MKPGDPGLDTWPSLDAARHGGGQVWIPGVYDPETKLYIFGTGNPTPGYTGVGRKGDNLFTCSLVAVNVDTGKMAWYFQTSPHDTHDWDSAQTPILIDGDDQRPAAQAGLDRRAQRLLLHRRSRHRRARRHGEVRRDDRTGRRASARTASPEPNPGEGSDDSRLAGLAGRRRRHQLAAARLLARHRPVLHAGEQRLQHPLPDRSRSARLDGPRRQDGGRPSDRAATASTAIDSKTGKKVWRHAVAAGRRRRRRSADDRGRCCSPATAAATSSPSTPPTASRCGTRASATSRTRRRPTCSTASSYVLVAVGDTLYAFTLY